MKIIWILDEDSMAVVVETCVETEIHRYIGGPTSEANGELFSG